MTYKNLRIEFIGVGYVGLTLASNIENIKSDLSHLIFDIKSYLDWNNVDA